MLTDFQSYFIVALGTEFATRVCFSSYPTRETQMLKFYRAQKLSTGNCNVQLAHSKKY